MKISAASDFSSSTGKDSGEGLPAANEIIDGSVRLLKISRIADGFSAASLSEKIYSISFFLFSVCHADSRIGAKSMTKNGVTDLILRYYITCRIIFQE